ncbi:MAG TPA: SPFH domain-containing protein [Kineosporiaceae bacterium]|nr:SPFH domain-containing protein [Kineosporiaceae bacterium]
MNITVAGSLVGALALGVVVIVIVFKSMWRVAEPNQALIVSGSRARETPAGMGFRVVTGRGTFVIPGVQVVRKLSLDINEAPLAVQCVTKQGIDVGVQGVVIFKVGDDETSIANAARRFLDQQDKMVQKIVNVFEGHLRSIIGSLTMEEIVRERERLTQETWSAAGVELEKLGLVIDTLQIKDLHDPTGYIANLARPHAAEVEKHARIAEAVANQQATEAEAAAQARQAEAVRTSRIAQAQYQAEVDQVAAKAQQAGPLAAAAARQEVVVQETEVAKLEASRREQQLEAEVRRPADASRYRVEQEAQAARSAAIAEAEARRAAVIAAAEADAEKARLTGEAEKSRRTAIADAEAIEGARRGEAEKARRVAEAEAVRAEGEAQAAAIRATGDAEASAIRAKGLAEAEAVERRAEALATNSEAVVLQEIAENYPLIVANAAKAFEGVGSMQVLNGAEGVTEMLTTIIGQGLAGLNVVRSMIDGGSTGRTAVSRTVARSASSGAAAAGEVAALDGASLDGASGNESGR